MKRKILSVCTSLLLVASLFATGVEAGAVTYDSDSRVSITENDTASRLGTVDGHLEYIRSELLRYDEAKEYFERYGISIKLRDYIIECGVDLDLPELAELISINDQHIAELFAEEESYDLLLKNNADLFVKKCNELATLTDYLSIKRACDEAEYYLFNMDVSVPGVQYAINVYDSKLNELSLMEYEAEKFIDAAWELTVSVSTENLPELILTAHTLSLVVDHGVDGVNDAIESLRLAMEKYNESIACYNAEISNTRTVAAALRSYEGAEGFVTFILEVMD